LGHDLLKLLLLVLEVVLLLVVALIASVIPVGVVALVGGVELLPLGAVDDVSTQSTEVITLSPSFDYWNENLFMAH
jgi:hypothetical protein